MSSSRKEDLLLSLCTKQLLILTSGKNKTHPFFLNLMFKESLAVNRHIDNHRSNENKQKATMKEQRSITFSESLFLKTKIQDCEQLSTKVDDENSRLY